MQAEAGGASLDLRELRQVLQDEELAHKLQEEEERLLRRVDGGFRGHKRTKECILIIYFVLLPFCFHRTLGPLHVFTQRETSEWHKWRRMRYN